MQAGVASLACLLYNLHEKSSADPGNLERNEETA